MIKTSTPNDVLRLLYNEASEEEKQALASSLLFDEVLDETYENFKELLEQLDLVGMNPSQKTVDAILTYSKSYPLHSTE